MVATTRKPRYVVLVALVGMIGAMGALLVLRSRPAEGQLLRPAAEARTGDSAKPAAPGDGAEAGERIVRVGEARGEGETPLPPLLDRPIRVVGLGWDVLVPGHLAAAKGEGGAASPFEKGRIEVELRAVRKVEKLKEALARGGGDKHGADIAILPLPEMVAAYEDLRALEPRIFYLVGWSQGREGLYAMKGDLLHLPRRKPVTVVGDRDRSATVLALYVLDAAGVSPERVKLVKSGGRGAHFAAVDRTSSTEPDGARVVLTTADASNLVPLVAIAPRGFLAKREAVRAWTAGWQEGVDLLRSDVPAAARRVADDKSPEALELVRQLGLLHFADLADNARRLGLSGRDAVTLEELFVSTWKLWREAGVLTTPAPSSVPLSTDAIASLILEAPRKPSSPAGQRPDFTSKPILRIAVRKPGKPESLHRLGLAAGVFSRSALRLGVGSSRGKSDTGIGNLAARYGLAKERFQSAPRLSRRHNAVLEILAAP